MVLSSDDIIAVLRTLSENLKLGRSFEASLFIAIKNLPNENIQKEKWLRQINIGNSFQIILEDFYLQSKDSSLARVWNLLGKISALSSVETGEKVAEIVKHLELNKILMEKKDAIIKAQKYKVFFLGAITSLFLGVIAGLAPLFTTFMAIIRDTSYTEGIFILVPISLYIISESSVYFLSDISNIKFNVRIYLISSIIYAISFFLAKYSINLIL